MTIVFEGHIFNTSYELCSMDNLVFEIYQSLLSLTKCQVQQVSSQASTQQTLF